MRIAASQGFNVKGHFNCGAVRFEIGTDVSEVFICHCSICRRFTGSSGIAVVLVDNGQFRWLSGEENISAWKKPNSEWESWFCQTCGSAVPGNNDSKRVFVPAGLIANGAGKLRVAHHIFVEPKASWDEIGDNGKQHSGAFDRRAGEGQGDGENYTEIVTYHARCP